MYVETECASEKLVNQRLAYVAVSRGQYDARIYTDDRVKLPRVLDRDGSHPSALDLTPPARRALDRLLSPAILRTPGASCKSGTALALPCKYGPPSGCSRDSRARVRPRQLHAPRRGGSGIQAENWPEKRRSSRPSCAPSVIRIRFPSCAR